MTTKNDQIYLDYLKNRQATENNDSGGLGAFARGTARGFTEGIGAVPKGVSDIFGGDDESALYEAGEYIADLGPDLTRGEAESASGKFGQTLGSLASFVAGGGGAGLAARGAGLAARGARVASLGATTAQGTAVGASEQVEDIKRTLMEREGRSPTAEERHDAALAGMVPGATEALPVDILLSLASKGKLNPASLRTLIKGGTGKTRIAKEVAKGATLGAVTEATQENIQQAMHNAIAKDVLGYDTERAYFESVGETAALAGGAGGLMGAVMSALGIRAKAKALGAVPKEEQERLKALAEMIDGNIEANRKYELDRAKLEEQRKARSERVGKAKEAGAKAVGEDVRDVSQQFKAPTGGEDVLGDLDQEYYDIKEVDDIFQRALNPETQSAPAAPNLEGLVFHGVENTDNIPSIMKNGLFPGTNVAEGDAAQSLDSPITLVYEKGDLDLASKGYNPNESIVASQKVKKPVSALVNISDLGLDEGTVSEDIIEQRLEALEKVVNNPDLATDVGYYSADLVEGNGRERREAIKEIKQKYGENADEVIKLSKDSWNISEEGTPAETVDDRVAKITKDVDVPVQLITTDEDGNISSMEPWEKPSVEKPDVGETFVSGARKALEKIPGDSREAQELTEAIDSFLNVLRHPDKNHPDYQKDLEATKNNLFEKSKAAGEIVSKDKMAKMSLEQAVRILDPRSKVKTRPDALIAAREKIKDEGFSTWIAAHNSLGVKDDQKEEKPVVRDVQEREELGVQEKQEASPEEVGTSGILQEEKQVVGKYKTQRSAKAQATRRGNKEGVPYKVVERDSGWDIEPTTPESAEEIDILSPEEYRELEADARAYNKIRNRKDRDRAATALEEKWAAKDLDLDINEIITFIVKVNTGQLKIKGMEDVAPLSPMDAPPVKSAPAKPQPVVVETKEEDTITNVEAKIDALTIKEGVEGLSRSEEAKLQSLNSLHRKMLNAERKREADKEAAEIRALEDEGRTDFDDTGFIDDDDFSFFKTINQKRAVSPKVIEATLNAQIAKMEKTGASGNLPGLKFHIIHDVNDITEPRVRASKHAQKGSEAAAFVTNYKDKDGDRNVYFMVERIPNVHFAKIVFFHEAYGHYGMYNMFERFGSGKYKTFLRNSLKNTPGLFKEAHKALASLYVGDDKHKITLKPRMFKRSVNLDGYKVDEEGAERLLDEYIAYLSKDLVNNPQLFNSLNKTQKGLMKRFIAWVKHALRSFGLTKGPTGSPLTREDIYSLLSESYNYHTGKTGAASIASSLIKKYGREKFSTRTNDKDSNMYVSPILTPEQETEAVNGVKEASEGSGLVDLQQSDVPWINRWRNRVDQAFEKMRNMPYLRKSAFFGGVQGRAKYEKLEQEPRGKIFAYQEQARLLSKSLNKLSDPQKMAVHEFFTTRDTDVEAIPGISASLKNILTKAKADIENLGERLVDLGLLPKEVHEKTRGAYLHTQYLGYLLQDRNFKGAGKRPSFMDYLKKEKDLSEIDREVRSQVKDPAILVPDTLGTIGRDVVLLELFKEMKKTNEQFDTLNWFRAPGKNATGQDRTVNIDGTNYNYWELLDEIERVNTARRLGIETMPIYTSQPGFDVREEHYNKLLRVRKSLEEDFLDRTIEEMKTLGIESGREITPDMAREYLKRDFVKTSNKDYWLGDLKGHYIRKEIYNDMVDVARSLDTSNLDGVAKLMAPGGTLEKITQYWKFSKVGANPSSWVRNTIGNGMLLDFSTPTNTAKLSKMLVEEFNALIRSKNGKYKDDTFIDEAMKHGLFSTTFSASELYLLEKDYTATLKRGVQQKGIKGMPLKGLWMLNDGFLSLAEILSRQHGRLEGLFKTVSMRDYVERWEKQSGKSYKELGDEQRKKLFASAARFANEAIFDYSKVPAWLRSFRRTPIGSPFFTFIYKSFPALAKGMAKHPQKAIKYYLAPYLITQALLAAGNMDEDDYEEALKMVPQHMAEKSSLFIFPIKDKNGSLSYVDLSYIYPQSQFIDAALKVRGGMRDNTIPQQVGETLIRDMGVFGGPIPNLLTAIQSNKDPFTQREIVDGNLSAEERYLQMMNYIWTLAMPPLFTEYGMTGKMYKQATDSDFSQLGYELHTPGQAFASGLGLTAGKVNPREAKIKELKRLSFEQNSIKQKYRKQLKDPNTKNVDKPEIISIMRSQLRRLNEKRAAYLKEGY